MARNNWISENKVRMKLAGIPICPVAFTILPPPSPLLLFSFSLVTQWRRARCIAQGHTYTLYPCRPDCGNSLPMLFRPRKSGHWLITWRAVPVLVWSSSEEESDCHGWEGPWSQARACEFEGAGVSKGVEVGRCHTTCHPSFARLLAVPVLPAAAGFWLDSGSWRSIQSLLSYSFLPLAFSLLYCSRLVCHAPEPIHLSYPTEQNSNV